MQPTTIRRFLFAAAILPALTGCQQQHQQLALDSPTKPTAASLAEPAPKASPAQAAGPAPAPAYDEFATFGPYDKPGFVTVVQDSRIWIFRQGSKELAEFQKFGELAKHVTIPGSGPGGMTALAPDAGTIYNYMHSLAKPGFVTLFSKDGRLWVFRPGSKDLAEYQKYGELSKCVTLPGAGPLGLTLKSPDRETALAYLAAKPGFVTVVRDERVWIFKPASNDLAEFRSAGELGKCVTRPGVGPCGVTVRSADGQTIDTYLVTR